MKFFILSSAPLAAQDVGVLTVAMVTRECFRLVGLVIESACFHLDVISHYGGRVNRRKLPSPRPADRCHVQRVSRDEIRVSRYYSSDNCFNHYTYTIRRTPQEYFDHWYIAG